MTEPQLYDRPGMTRSPCPICEGIAEHDPRCGYEDSFGAASLRLDRAIWDVETVVWGTWPLSAICRRFGLVRGKRP